MTAESTAAAATTAEQKQKPTVIPPPKPKLSKAERRALQEAQRAAKAAGTKLALSAKIVVPTKEEVDATTNKEQPVGTPTDNSTQQRAQQDTAAANTPYMNKTVSLVSHLTPFRHTRDVFHLGATLEPRVADSSLARDYNNLHPAVLRLGAASAQMDTHDRCRAMLLCYSLLIQEFQMPADADIRRALDTQVLKPPFHYWTRHCAAPHSVGMGNAFDVLKQRVASLPPTLRWEQVQSELQETIHAYVTERIDYATKAIATLAPVSGADVVVTFAPSPAVTAVLVRAQPRRVIVVDGAPNGAGRALLRELRANKIQCSYCSLPAIAYVLQEGVTKVLLGAEALMSDGSILAPAGTACVALAAHARRISVLVCSETYKISNRIQLEAITNNELGDPDKLVGDLKWTELEYLKVLNLKFDLTPAKFVTGIVTELGIVPPSSVAVLLREMNPHGV
jgi:translation initiation factor eIF-2B subunit delta